MNNFMLLADRLAMPPDFGVLVLTFFAYSFFGYVMECIVLTIEKKHLVINRGFTSHLPFCIIYGGGAMIGFITLAPLRGNLLLLYLAGALAATAFEFVVGSAQQRLFGSFWWDYNKKPLNYKGMICLESTLGWGIVAVVIIRGVHLQLVSLIGRVPQDIRYLAAFVLLSAYVLDFMYSARVAYRDKQNIQQADAIEQKQ